MVDGLGWRGVWLERGRFEGVGGRGGGWLERGLAGGGLEGVGCWLEGAWLKGLERGFVEPGGGGRVGFGWRGGWRGAWLEGASA